MFKDIISRDAGEPWPSQGMTSKKWLSVEPREVQISDLIATQDGIYFRGLHPDTIPVGGDPIPHVIHWQNKFYLEDGHHRVVRAALRGEKVVLARVLSIV